MHAGRRHKDRDCILTKPSLEVSSKSLQGGLCGLYAVPGIPHLLFDSTRARTVGTKSDYACALRQVEQRWTLHTSHSIQIVPPSVPCVLSRRMFPGNTPPPSLPPSLYCPVVCSMKTTRDAHTGTCVCVFVGCHPRRMDACSCHLSVGLGKNPIGQKLQVIILVNV